MAEPFTIYKLTILYMLDKAGFPLSNTQISNFFLEKEYTDYFRVQEVICLLYTSPSPRDRQKSRMPSSA